MHILSTRNGGYDKNIEGTQLNVYKQDFSYNSVLYFIYIEYIRLNVRIKYDTAWKNESH
jgi:hypothetical protein